MPRDRDGTFEPQIVKKRQRRLTGVDEMVISLTAKGLTTGEVSAHMAEVYGGEGAKFWLQVLTKIKNRGVEDVCIVVCDGLKGLPEAIGNTWPLAIVQTCVLHLIRNTFRFASKADWDKISRDLRPVYTAISEHDAKERFVEFAEECPSL